MFQPAVKSRMSSSDADIKSNFPPIIDKEDEACEIKNDIKYIRNMDELSLDRS